LEVEAADSTAAARNIAAARRNRAAALREAVRRGAVRMAEMPEA